MERQQFFATGAGTAAALLLAAQTGIAPAAAAASGQMVSDQDVWRVRGRLTGMIAQLGDLAGDYAGNRLAAINAITQAKTDLDAAIKVRGLSNPLSDLIMRAALEETTEMIGRLNSDKANYNGTKEAAIVQLTTAENSLKAALRTA
jgi:hypothetical protein